jgi:tetratricopeptide (TPR) repeat protein
MPDMSRLDQLMKLREADPADADVPYMIAQEHAKIGEHEQAVQWYDACLASDDAYLYAYFHKAASLESLDREGEAIIALRDGLAKAQAARDDKAIGEIGGYLTQLGG